MRVGCTDQTRAQQPLSTQQPGAIPPTECHMVLRRNRNSHSVPMVTGQEDVCALLPTPRKLGVLGEHHTEDHALADETGSWTGAFRWGETCQGGGLWGGWAVLSVYE